MAKATKKYRFTLVLNQEEAEYLRNLLGQQSGIDDPSYAIFNAVTDAIDEVDASPQH